MLLVQILKVLSFACVRMVSLVMAFFVMVNKTTCTLCVHIQTVNYFIQNFMCISFAETLSLLQTSMSAVKILHAV